MKDKIEYILGSPERALEFIVIVLTLVACMVVMTGMYGWAGLVLDLAITVTAVAVARLTRGRRN